MNINTASASKQNEKKLFNVLRIIYKPFLLLLIIVAVIIAIIEINNHVYFGAAIIAKADTPKSDKNLQLDSGYIESVQSLGNNTLSSLLLSEDGKNQLVSPLSLSMCGSMLLSGAAGETYTELKSALQFNNMSDIEIAEQNKLAFEKLCRYNNDIKINIVNSIWFNKNYSIKQKFLNDCKDTYFADIFIQDFKSSKNVVNNINKWVRNRSGGDINNIIDHIDNSDVMCLLNSVYFEGDWQTKFDKTKTAEGVFVQSQSKQYNLDFMYSDKDTEYLWADNYKAACLPYKDGMSMILLMPKDIVSLVDLLKNKNEMCYILNHNWENAKLIKNFQNAGKIEIAVPKFSFDKETDLMPVLQNMGVKSAFTDQADFQKLQILMFH